MMPKSKSAWKPSEPACARLPDSTSPNIFIVPWRQEDLIRAVFQGCGYRCEKLPVPDVPAFQTGKEFGNNGQCNPTYFTVRNLVQYLQFLEKEGLPRQQILDNYVFFTAGSCGPCRFGMYEAEYRFALKNAGFDGFRVLLFKDS